MKNDRISFWKYHWINSKITMVMSIIIFPLFSLIASILDGKFVGGFLWGSLFLIVVTLVGDFFAWKKRFR